MKVARGGRSLPRRAITIGSRERFASTLCFKRPLRRVSPQARHGASPTTVMTHIAIQEALDGKAVEWKEHLTEEEYRGARSGH